ncbi:MAG: ABC transporter ATP-binding protein [Thermoanaerobaculia bacterium]
MTDVLAIQGLDCAYGEVQVLYGVSLSLRRGEVLCLLGRNGAGKSTLVRCLLGQLRPDHGTATIFGKDVWRHRASLMDRIGIVPEEADAPPEMRVREVAAFSSRLYSRWDHDAFDGRIRTFGISGAARFGDLSKGQKKQVMLALALATSPDLVVLDDPTLGLDVVAKKSLFEEVLADMADRGITVLITTHDLSSIEAIADRIGILKDGRLVLDEEVETLKARFRRVRFAAPRVELTGGLLNAAAIRQWGGGTEAIVTNFDDLALERFRDTTNNSPAEITTMSLEDIFIAVAGEHEGGQS